MQNLEDKIIKEFRQKFCNDHQEPIRFLRSVFYDEQDGAEQIEEFIKQALKQQKAEIIKKAEMNQKGQFETDDGMVCWYLDDLLNMLNQL